MTPTEPTAARDNLENLRSRLQGRYAIERELGRGGMGAVYLGRDLKLDRHVALKVLPSEFAVQPMLRDRFLRETRTAAGFSHPNIVPVYAVEESDDLLAYAMGYVEGESLMERVRRAGPLNVRELVKLMQDVAYALAYAHGRGIVHRDIKPDNIMLERASGRALVLDFGIARAKSNAPATAAGLTRIGEVVGTPEYMSPEQASGDEVDGRSDLYSLGLTMMFAATGKIAVTAETTQKVLVKQLTEALPSIASLRADLPEVLISAIDRCVLKNPSERFEMAEALVDALDVAQLAAPEIPLPIRLFHHELSTLTFIGLVFVFGTAFVLRNLQSTDRGSDESLFIIVLLLAIVTTRTTQTLREAKRLAVTGFTPEEISSGLERVVDEYEIRRAELRADAQVLRNRRRTVAAALVMLVVAVVCFRFALNFRQFVRPGLYEVGLWGTVLVAFSMFYVGVGLVLLFKSPLKMPVGERVFRLLWLSRFGRAFIRFGGRKVLAVRNGKTLPGASGNTRHTRSLSPTPVSRTGAIPVTTIPSNAGAAVAPLADDDLTALTDVDVRLDSIERRLTTLEQSTKRL